MKTISLYMTASLFLLTACGSAGKTEGEYTVKGRIDNVPDSCQVILRAIEGYRGPQIVDTVYTAGGRFEFKGELNAPVLARILIIKDDIHENREIEFMLDEGTTEIYAPDFDSIPKGWYVGTAEKLKERNVKIKGGKAQEEYQEYVDFLFPYDLAMKEAHYNAYWVENDRKLSEAEQQEREKPFHDATVRTFAAMRQFVDEHPQYNISMMRMGMELDMPYYVDADRLDFMVASTKDSRWSSRRDTLAASVERYRPVAAGQPFVDVKFTTEKGDTVALSDYAGKGKWTLVDFWASWCGPCRAAIPRVKAMYEADKEKLNVVSVSLDKDEDAWRKAMKSENMPWTQLRADGQLVNVAKDAYDINAIPTFVLITPDGKIALETHEVMDLSDRLK